MMINSLDGKYGANGWVVFVSFYLFTNGHWVNFPKSVIWIKKSGSGFKVLPWVLIWFKGCHFTSECSSICRKVTHIGTNIYHKRTSIALSITKNVLENRGKHGCKVAQRPNESTNITSFATITNKYWKVGLCLGVHYVERSIAIEFSSDIKNIMKDIHQFTLVM